MILSIAQCVWIPHQRLFEFAFFLPLKAESGGLGRYKRWAYLHHIYCRVKNRTTRRYKSYTLIEMCECVDLFGGWFLILNIFGTPSIMTLLYLVDGRWYIFGEHGLQRRTCLFFLNGDLDLPLIYLIGPLSILCSLASFFFRMTEVAHVSFWCKEFWLERCHDEGQGVNFWDNVCATLRVSVGNFIWWMGAQLSG